MGSGLFLGNSKSATVIDSKFITITGFLQKTIMKIFSIYATLYDDISACVVDRDFLNWYISLLEYDKCIPPAEGKFPLPKGVL